MANTDKCACLRAVTKEDTPNIGANCIATSDSQCPKIRSTKRQVGPQCWRIKPVKPVEPKEPKPAKAEPAKK